MDRLDEDLLARSADQVSDEVAILRRLQELRQQVRYLRQVLSPHREIFGRLSHPESDAFTGSNWGANYERLSERVQQALDSLDTTREMIIGSFEIFTTRTAQATNDIMKRLTIISVLLLPASVLAGIMGMNFRLGFFDRSWVFWVVLAVMATIAGVTIFVAKRRNWI